MIDLLGVLLFCVAFALFLWIMLTHDDTKCPDCFHLIEDHDHHCMHCGCMCQYSQAELRAMTQ